jgi:hypothetical protein
LASTADPYLVSRRFRCTAVKCSFCSRWTPFTHEEISFLVNSLESGRLHAGASSRTKLYSVSSFAP